MKGAKASGAPEPKAQKTIFHFFGKQSQAPAPPVTKVTCPACSLQVPQSKINWHLDQDCKSRSKPKRKTDKNLAKRKKILKSVKDDIASRKRQKVMLSDEESDGSCEVKVLGEDYESDDAEEPYITPSMIETRIFELDGEVECKTPGKGEVASPVTGSENAVSPYFSPNSKNTRGSPLKRSEKVVDYQVPSSSNSCIAMLESDWTSPHSTPTKSEARADDEIRPPGKVTAPESNCVSQEVREMLEKDWSTDSPGSTPRKLSLSKKRPSPLSNISKSEDELEDFEESSFKFNTPHKVSKECSKGSPSSSKGSPSSLKDMKANLHPKNKISPEKTSILNCSKTDEDSEDEFEDNPVQFRTPEKPLRKRLKNLSGSCKKDKVSSESPKASSVPSSPVSTCSEDSLPLFTPPLSPSLVSPTRSPSPLVNSAVKVGEGSSSISNENGTNEDKYVRKLFTSNSSPTKTSQESTTVETLPSTSKMNLSPSIKSSANRFSKIDKFQDGEGDPFDALCNTAAQSQENSVTSQNQELPSSQSQSPGKTPRIWVRTPRKINQSVKSTGILQNSPQNVSRSLFGRRPQSTSPEKREAGSQDLSQGSQGNSPYKEYDKAMFRGHKGYYLENFLMIMETVLSEPSDLQLFDDKDMSVVKSFHGLSLQAQKLYVRLFQRKVKWNKVSKIEYRDICETEDMQLYVNELSYASFLVIDNDLNDLDEVLQLLSAEELKALCKQFKISATGKKEDLAKALLKLTKQQRSGMSVFSKGSSKDNIVIKKAKELMGHCCIINREVRRVFMRIIMLYGLPKYDDEDDRGNYTQLTAILLVNLGKMNFPKYDVIRHHAIFQSRDDIIRFEGCSQILSDLHECLDGQKWEEALNYCDVAMTTYKELISDKDLLEHDMSLPGFLRSYTSISVLVYILSCSVECYQRLKDYRNAVKRLEFLLNQTTHLQDYRGRWYDRLALNLDTHLHSPKAVEVIREGLNDPEVRQGHRLALSVRADRMAASSRFKHLAPSILEMPLMNPREAPKVIIEGRSLPGYAGYKKVFIRQGSDRHAGEGEVTACSVEELVLQHYKDLGYTEGLHREGTTMNSLFGIFFWDILYSPVPDVFRSPHQAAPLDLDDPHFYTSRKELIEERLSQLRNWTDEEAGEEMERIWKEHMGETAVIAWDVFRSVEYAKGLVASITMPVLASICRRLAEDHRFTRSGFPDLVVWDPFRKRSRIVEVKGPQDRLSPKQILWLDYLLEHGAAAEVCHVKAIGAKKMNIASPKRISPKKRSPRKKSTAENDEWTPAESASSKKISPKKRSPRKKNEEGTMAESASPKIISPKKRSPRKKNTAENAEGTTAKSVPKTKDKKGPKKQTRKQSKKAEEEEDKKAEEEDEGVKPRRRSSRKQSEDGNGGKKKSAQKKKCPDDDDFEDTCIVPPKKSRQSR